MMNIRKVRDLGVKHSGHVSLKLLLKSLFVVSTGSASRNNNGRRTRTDMVPLSNAGPGCRKGPKGCMYIKDFILRNLVLIFATHRATDSPCFTMVLNRKIRKTRFNAMTSTRRSGAAQGIL